MAKGIVSKGKENNFIYDDVFLLRVPWLRIPQLTPRAEPPSASPFPRGRFRAREKLRCVNVRDSHVA